MADLPPLDPLVRGDPAHSAAATRRRRRKRGRGPRRFLVLFCALLVVAIAALAGLQVVRTIYQHITASDDYKGNGTGTVTVQIAPGQSGRSIGATLEKDGVVKTAGAFAALAAPSP